VVHEQAVREDDGLRAPAGFFVEKLDAVGVDGGHAANLAWRTIFSPRRHGGTEKLPELPKVPKIARIGKAKISMIV
jgi:hypothetical protein